jgi:AAA domain-containing protein
MAIQFTKATKKQAKLRLALMGPAGSGKTYTALTIAQHFGDKIALLDSEGGSASKYADIFTFDTITPDSFEPNLCTEAIHAAESAGYDVLIIDSWSAFWAGTGGALEQVDIATKRSRSGNKFTDGWGEVTPMQTRMVDAILSAKLHVIATMRVKTEYVIEENERGKKVPRRIGLQPIQRSGMEYEFDVVADIDLDNSLSIGKTRCSAIKDKVYKPAGENLASVLKAWLTDGAPVPEPAAQPVALKAVAAAPKSAEQQHKTHHDLRVMLTLAKNGADLDATKLLIGKAYKDGFLSQDHMKDLVEYGKACRGKIDALDRKAATDALASDGFLIEEPSDAS